MKKSCQCFFTFFYLLLQSSMPHHTSNGRYVRKPSRGRERGYTHHHDVENTIKTVLKGRLARPFADRLNPFQSKKSNIYSREKSTIDNSASSSILARNSISRNSISRSNNKLIVSQSDSQLIRHPVDSSTSSPREFDTLRVQQVYSASMGFDTLRNHRNQGMSPWNEEDMMVSVSDMSVPKSHKRVRKRYNNNNNDNTTTTTTTTTTNNHHHSSSTNITIEKRKRLPSISMEIQGLFAKGSRIEDEDVKRPYKKSSSSSSSLSINTNMNNNNNQSSSPPRSRALSPFSQMMERKRLNSPELLCRSPMSADVHASEFYQLKYNRASTVTPGGISKRNQQKESKLAFKKRNEKRAKMLLMDLKSAIKAKQKLKKIALQEQRGFTAEFELREKVSKPLPKPTNCHLPDVCAPNQHPSHPKFAQFFPKQIENVTGDLDEKALPLGVQLSHSRLASYQFNVLKPPPLLNKMEDLNYQRELLKSKDSSENEKLAQSFWSRLNNQENVEKELNNKMTSMTKKKRRNRNRNRNRNNDEATKRRKQRGVATIDEEEEEEEDVDVEDGIPMSPISFERRPKIFFATKAEQDEAKERDSWEETIYLNYFSPAV